MPADPEEVQKGRYKFSSEFSSRLCKMRLKYYNNSQMCVKNIFSLNKTLTDEINPRSDFSVYIRIFCDGLPEMHVAWMWICS